MSQEEWIIFRSKSYRFEEFLGQWYDKISNSTNKSTITVKLLKEIEQHKNILPVLKYVRGEIFSDQHWNEMYGILNMPRKGISELKFQDFLNVKQRLVDHAEELQELNNRAGLFSFDFTKKIEICSHILTAFCLLLQLEK